MRPRPIHLAAIPLAAVAIPLACDLPVSPNVDAPAPTAPTRPAAEVPTSAPPAPSRSSLALVGPTAHSALHGPADHSNLGVEAHVDLHVTQTQENEASSDERVLAALRAAGASGEQLDRWRREMKESRNRDAEHLRALLTDVLER